MEIPMNLTHLIAKLPNLLDFMEFKSMSKTQKQLHHLQDHSLRCIKENLLQSLQKSEDFSFVTLEWMMKGEIRPKIVTKKSKSIYFLRCRLITKLRARVQSIKNLHHHLISWTSKISSKLQRLLKLYQVQNQRVTPSKCMVPLLPHIQERMQNQIRKETLEFQNLTNKSSMKSYLQSAILVSKKYSEIL